MPNMEKVKKGLEVCISVDEGENCPKECPYYRDVCLGCNQVMRDALAMLNEQEEEIENLKQMAQSMMEGICLLKEQGAVKPSILDYPSGRRRAWCGKCGYRVKIGYHGDCTENFCGKCGTPVNWEGW